MCTLIPRLSSLGGITRLVLLHGIGDIFCCYSFLLDFVHLRVGPGILHLYARTTLPDSSFQFVVSCLRHSLVDPLFVITTQKHGIRAFVFYFEFFIAQKSSITFGRGESE